MKSKELIQNNLLEAAYDNDKDKVQELLKDNQDDIINSQDESGNTPLHWAVRNSNKGMVKLLLENGADVNKDTTVLDWVTCDENPEIALLSPTKANESTGIYTPLYIAAFTVNKDIIKLLLNNGADINKADEHGYTPLSLILSDNELLPWFKEQFNEDSLSKYNNIGKFELLRGLYYIQKHPNIIDGKYINIEDVDSYITKIGTDCIKGTFEDIRKDINSLSVDENIIKLTNHANRLKILSKVKLINDLIKQSKDFNDYSPEISNIISQDLDIGKLTNDIKDDLITSIKGNELVFTSNILKKYINLCEDMKILPKLDEDSVKNMLNYLYDNNNSNFRRTIDDLNNFQENITKELSYHGNKGSSMKYKAYDVSNGVGPIEYVNTIGDDVDTMGNTEEDSNA